MLSQHAFVDRLALPAILGRIVRRTVKLAPDSFEIIAGHPMRHRLKERKFVVFPGKIVGCDWRGTISLNFENRVDNETLPMTSAIIRQ